MKYLGEALTYKDVALVPQYNNVASRTEPSLETYLTKDITMKLPFLAANMDTVISEDLAKVLIDNGIIPIWHRFSDTFDLIRIANTYNNKIFMSIGVNENFEFIRELYDCGVLGFCVDVAHGHSLSVIRLIEKLKKELPKAQIIAGSVCTPGGYVDLVNAGADAVRCGIGNGSICITRKVTGFGSPQFSALLNCCEEAEKYRVPVIADGGIEGPDDIAKALAAGACSVMCGKLFGRTVESAAKKSEIEGEKYAWIRGQASKDFQVDFKGGLKPGTVPEGEAFWVKCSGTAQEKIDELAGSIRSAFTYGGARCLKEFQRKAAYVKVMPESYSKESNTRRD